MVNVRPEKYPAPRLWSHRVDGTVGPRSRENQFTPLLFAALTGRSGHGLAPHLAESSWVPANPLGL